MVNKVGSRQSGGFLAIIKNHHVMRFPIIGPELRRRLPIDWQAAAQFCRE